MTTNEKVLIKVENLQKSFEDNKVLDGISTEIRQGEVVAVIRPFRFRKIDVSALLKPSGNSNRRKNLLRGR